ncbi:MAG: DUF3990 domain-containing protein [Acholeplasmataceae bacterium]|nr:DUF3990 domain-containing protein [Acholeplasmataceae bacterium]
MDVIADIKIIREILELSQKDFADKIGVSFETVNRWENGKAKIGKGNIEAIYNFAYENEIYLNEIYEQIIKEEAKKKKRILLFHGSKREIVFPLDLRFSKEHNDFGRGFYLGENFIQASTYISNTTLGRVYAFSLEIDNLKIAKFNVTTEWMLAISYYRGWISKYKNSEIIKNIVDKVENSDIIIAPIADNRMFDLISEFTGGVITDEQCKHALAATNLGDQYVVRTANCLEKLRLEKEFYLSNKEKNTYINKRLKDNKMNEDKVKVSRMKYRGKGLYIDELLK